MTPTGFHALGVHRARYHPRLRAKIFFSTNGQLVCYNKDISVRFFHQGVERTGTFLFWRPVIIRLHLC